MPVGTRFEQVGMAFNKGIVTDLLRNELGFKGIICTDWGLITDVELLGQDMPARAWGCEHLTELERVVKILEAGCDQFGGESRPELVVQAISEGLVTEERIDESVSRLLTEKFVLGLFDDKRFVNVEEAGDVLGNKQLMELGAATQRRSLTVLTNGSNAFPLPPQVTVSCKFYVEGLGSSDIAEQRGLCLVSSPAEADIALLRLRAPYEPRPGGFESKFHAGSLEFPAEEVARVVDIIERIPVTMLDVYLDRPAVLTPFEEAQERANQAAAAAAGADQKQSVCRGSTLMVNFGASDEAFLDGCLGVGDYLPEGRLPFDLPRSQNAADSSREDVAFDTENPLFRFGSGVEYKRK